MRRLLFVGVAVLLAMGLATSTHAAPIRYGFIIDSAMAWGDPLSGGFVYDAPAFITTNTQVPVANLVSCSTSIGVCYDEYFLPNEDPSNGPWNTVAFGVDNGGSRALIYFAFAYGTFGQLGTFYTDAESQNHGWLTITNLGGNNAVPDPASTLLLLTSGLIGLGWARRKWRP